MTYRLSSTVTSCEDNVQESKSCSVTRGWVSQLGFCRCWNPKEVCSKAREGMDVRTRPGQAGKE